MKIKNTPNDMSTCGCSIKNDIDRDLEREMNMDKWRERFKNHKTAVTITSFILLMIFIVAKGWYTKRKNDQIKIANDFFLLKQNYYNNNVSKALDIAKVLSDNNDGSGYAVMSRLIAASIMYDKSQTECIDEFKEIALDNKIPSYYSNYAYARYVNAALDLMKEDELLPKLNEMIDHINQLTASEAPWDVYLMLSESYCYIKLKKYNEAKEVLNKINNEKGTGTELKDRITTLINYCQQQELIQAENTNNNEMRINAAESNSVNINKIEISAQNKESSDNTDTQSGNGATSKEEVQQ